MSKDVVERIHHPHVAHRIDGDRWQESHGLRDDEAGLLSDDVVQTIEGTLATIDIVTRARARFLDRARFRCKGRDNFSGLNRNGAVARLQR